MTHMPSDVPFIVRVAEVGFIACAGYAFGLIAWGFGRWCRAKASECLDGAAVDIDA